jgi:hypothetical protein
MDMRLLSAFRPCSHTADLAHDSARPAPSAEDPGALPGSKILLFLQGSEYPAPFQFSDEVLGRRARASADLRQAGDDRSGLALAVS